MNAPTAVRWVGRKARQYAYAIGAGVLFAGVTIKTFWFTSPELVTALTGDYSALTIGVAGFIAVAIGLQQLGPPAPSPAPTTRGEADGRPEA